MQPNTSIQHTSDALDSDWINTAQAERVSRLKKSKLYELKDAGEIKSFVLKAHKNSRYGRRLFSRSSIIDYVNRKAKEAGAL